MRTRWTAEEEEELEVLFEKTLEDGITPRMKECLAAIAKSKADKGLIHNRSWENIKKKVCNMIGKSS